MTVLLAFGTRPEAIKLGPVAAELRVLKAPLEILCTGQHRELLLGTPAENDLTPAISLALPSHGNVLRWSARAEREAREYLVGHFDPIATIVVVQGDTMSALAIARAAVSADFTVAHVEAGVRSHDKDNPWPEEESRVEITHLATWHYAATPQAYANLLAEGVSQQRILLTGNPGVSALARYTDAKPQPPQPHILVTMHRREWLIPGDTVEETMLALAEEAYLDPRIDYIWPMHPAVHDRVNGKLAKFPSNVHVLGPLPYAKVARILASALGVLTDSGGLQEEAATLGVPCAVLRRACDRPEALEAGVARLFSPDGAGVRAAVGTLVSGALPRRPTDIYGTVGAATNIANHLARLGGLT